MASISIAPIDTVINFNGVNFDKDNTPAFTGSVTGLSSYANQTVQIRDSFSVIGTASVAPNGSWSFDFGSTSGRVLSDGMHNINVRLLNNGQAVNGVTSSYKVTIDTQTTTPTAFATPAATYIDAGGVQHMITNTASPVISGRGEPGAEINIFDRNTPNPDPSVPADQQFAWIGSTTVGADGNYSYALQQFNADGSVNLGNSTALYPDGVYNIGVTSTDIAGNMKSAAPISIEVDTVASSPFVYSLDTVPSSNVDGAAAVNGVVFTNDSTPAIKGYAETGSEVTVKDAAGNVLGTATANGALVNGKSEFTFQVQNSEALSQGIHTFNFVTTDRAGNVSSPTTAVIGVDSVTQQPTLSMADTTTAGGVNYTRDNTPTLSGVAEPGATVQFTDSSGNALGSVTANANTGAYSYTVPTPMVDGAKTITATATDALGNKASTNFDVKVDTRTEAPTLTDAAAINVNGVSLDKDNTPTITGTAEAGSTVTIKDGNTPLGTTIATPDGTYSFTPQNANAMIDGVHTLTATATDVAGNVSSTVTSHVTIDTRNPGAPTATIGQDTPPVTLHGVTYGTDRTPTITGTAEAGSTVTIKDGNAILGSVTAGENGAYSFTPVDANQLAGGTHNINVTATDLAGNVSSATAKSLSVVCYMSGTRLQTQNGWALVQDLQVGDLLKTVSGDVQPVVWLGESTIDCRRQQDKKNAYPVRIAQHAFGLNLPERDLYVSPLHSLYVQGVMIPAIHLVNGLTVTQEQQETFVTYYHVELPQHNAVFAEGLPAETYLDTTPENRHFFQANNGGQKVFAMDAQFPACPQGTPVWQHIWDTQGFAPLTQSGPILEAVKASLLARAQELLQEEDLLAA